MPEVQDPRGPLPAPDRLSITLPTGHAGIDYARRVARFARCAALAGILTLTRAAGATDAPSAAVADALSTEGPTECISRDALAEQVAAWLERREIDARITVQVRVDGSPPDAISFVIKRSGKPVAWRQFLEPPQSCADAKAAVSLAIALAIDATILETLGVVVPPPVPTPTPRPPPPPRPPEPSPAPVPEPPRTLDAGGALEGGALFRVLPATAVSGYGGLWVRWGLLEVRLGALASFGVETPLGRGTVTTSLAATRLDACFVRAFGAASFRSCAGAATGQLSARGEGYEESRETLVRWTAMALRLGARLPVTGPLAASVALDGFSPVVRPRLVVVDAGGSGLHAEQTPAAGGALAVALEAAFP